MRRAALTALLLAASTATPALAQPAGPGELRRDRQDIRQDRREVRDQRQDYRRNLAEGDVREARQDRRELQRDRAELRDSRQELRSDIRGDQSPRADARDDRRDWRQDRRDDRGDWRDNRRDGRSDTRGYDWNDRRQVNRDGWNDRRNVDRGRWNDGWRNDRRYDWQGYRSANRRAYSLPRYYAPSGFGYNYRRFGVGLRIGAPFYSQRYLISDPWAYRLPPAYGPYRWVRYFNDVLLIDTYTGVVQDALYGFFY